MANAYVLATHHGGILEARGKLRPLPIILVKQTTFATMHATNRRCKPCRVHELRWNGVRVGGEEFRGLCDGA